MDVYLILFPKTNGTHRMLAVAEDGEKLHETRHEDPNMLVIQLHNRAVVHEYYEQKFGQYDGDEYRLVEVSAEDDLPEKVRAHF